MVRTPSEQLYEESFGPLGGEPEHDGAPPPDPSLEFLDKRDVELAYWRWDGIFFFPMLIRLGKAWVIAVDVLALVAMLAFGLVGLTLLMVAMLPVIIVSAIYQYVSIGAWTADYNARVAARRAEASERHDP